METSDSSWGCTYSLSEYLAIIIVLMCVCVLICDDDFSVLKITSTAPSLGQNPVVCLFFVNNRTSSKPSLKGFLGGIVYCIFLGSRDSSRVSRHIIPRVRSLTSKVGCIDISDVCCKPQHPHVSQIKITLLGE